MVVGRDAECAALRAALDFAHHGAGPVVVLIAGEAGAGKTTLAEHVLADVPARVLHGRAAEWAGAAYDVLARALWPTASTVSSPDREVLAQILPELGTPLSSPDPAALASAICAVLTGPGKTVLFLDDLQWADDATLSLLPPLADAISRVGGRAIVGCYRSDELARGHRLRTVRAQLRKAGQLSEIRLGSLGDDDLRLMLGTLLGAAPQQALVTVVSSRADGLPFAVEELACALRDAGRLIYQDGTVALAGSGATPVPEGIREAVLLRVSRLTEEERALLEVAAVAGVEFDIDSVLRAASDAGNPMAWPDRFTAVGLLTEPSDGRAAFRHSLIQEAAYADIPWSRRRGLHQALASALSADDSTKPGHVARHLLAARDFEQARTALLAAADEYCGVHAYRDATRALKTALDHWPGDTDSAGRLQAIDQLARCAEMCSEYADAVALLRELADGHEHRGDLLAVAATHRRLALAHELRGHWESVLAARETAAKAYAQAGRSDEAAVDRIAVAAHLRSAASYSAALATLSVVSANARAGGRADLQLRAEGLRGNVLSRLGNSGEGIVAVRAALEEALKAELPDTAAELQQRLADSLEHSGDYDAATKAYSAAYQYCDAHGKDAMGQLCRACATAVLFSRGQWDLAIAACEDVLSSAEALPHSRAVASCILGLVHAQRGKTRRARPHLLEASVVSARIELTAVELLSAWGLAIIEEQACAYGAAAERAHQLLDRRKRTQERHYCVPALQWAATFFGSHGRPADAHACAAILSEISATTAQPEAIASLAHAFGETLLPDDPAAAARELRRAAAMFGELGLPFATALAEHRAAVASIAAGDAAGARELLRAAQQGAGRLGARPLLAYCAGVLSQLGDRTRTGKTGTAKVSPVAGLTAREIDVMRLVADGNTSKEAGAALFISPRTVEMHVQGCLLKLGCRTRAEAVRKLAELGALPA
jgi:DNA-binding CsgD family transcriptional regulator/tetratricopeptide (TPR) repeat protein